jgi:Tol biopolymer transport system component
VHDRVTNSTTRVSVASDGTQANAESAFVGAPQLSADGRFVAFESFASNLVSGDTNGILDIFVHDRQTSTTTLVSVASDGTQADGGSESPAVSADGRFVAFESVASNLVPGDTNGAFDVFVHDRQTGAVTRVSVASDGTQADNTSRSASISADGRFVAFHSFATNLVQPDTNPDFDVFVHDRQTGTTTRANVASDGTQANSGPSVPPLRGFGSCSDVGSQLGNAPLGERSA